MIVSNVPLTWPLIRRIFALRSWGSSDSSGNTETTAAVLRVPTAQDSIISPRTTRNESLASTAFPRVVPHEGIMSEGNGVLDNARSNVGSRARSQSGPSAVDIDIDLELGRLAAVEDGRHRRSLHSYS